MTPERFTNLDEWSQALDPCPCKTALRELVAELESTRRRLQMALEYGKGAAETIYQHGVRIIRLCRRVARWKHVAAEYKRRLEATAVKHNSMVDELQSERRLVADLAEEGQGLAAERDALRQRVAVLEQRLDDVPCAWTEPVPDYPHKRVRAKSVRAT